MKKRSRCCRASGCSRKDLLGFDGYCEKHYKQMREHGKIYRSCYDRNETTDYGDFIGIHLYNADSEKIAETVIDKEDSWVLKRKWRLGNTGYAICDNATLLHRVLCPDFKEIDHIDRDKLNNRRSNLRECSHSGNMINRGIQKNNKSGIPGVCWDNGRSKWMAHAKVNRKTINLGRFDSIDDAVKARKQAEIKYYGEFAPNN